MVRIIDWETPEQNDFFLASQVWFAGELYTKRADLVGFVNGLPLLFVELKASHKAMADAYTGNLSDYRATIPHVFTPNAFVILSNGLEAVLARHMRRWNILTNGSGSTTKRNPASSVSTR